MVIYSGAAEVCKRGANNGRELRDHPGRMQPGDVRAGPDTPGRSVRSPIATRLLLKNFKYAVDQRPLLPEFRANTGSCGVLRGRPGLPDQSPDAGRARLAASAAAASAAAAERCDYHPRQHHGRRRSTTRSITIAIKNADHHGRIGRTSIAPDPRRARLARKTSRTSDASRTFGVAAWTSHGCRSRFRRSASAAAMATTASAAAIGKDRRPQVRRQAAGSRATYRQAAVDHGGPSATAARRHGRGQRAGHGDRGTRPWPQRPGGNAAGRQTAASGTTGGNAAGR